MEYQKALQIAEKVKQQLEPYCDRIEIAGSIRRKKPEVKDIEIVAIPNDRFQIGLIINKWKKIEGNIEGKYMQRELPDEIRLDLFFATERNWGNILLIRTGDLDFCKKFMILILKNGYKQENGYLKKDEITIPILEEIELFKLVNLSFIEPNSRNKNAI